MVFISCKLLKVAVESAPELKISIFNHVYGLLESILDKKQYI